MAHVPAFKRVTTPQRNNIIDSKRLGYLAPIVSVLLLGAVVWPKPEDRDRIQLY